MSNNSKIRTTDNFIPLRGQRLPIAMTPVKSWGNLTPMPTTETTKPLPEILFITSFPPRECGIATYSQDLVKALNHKFEDSFSLKICALESERNKHEYTEGSVKYVFDTWRSSAYAQLADAINRNNRIKIVLIQHEFGLFSGHEAEFKAFLFAINKPIVMVFHTVLPKPDAVFKLEVQSLIAPCESVIVMTQNSEKLLKGDYDVPQHKISVIPHGTHLVPHLDKSVFKEKYNLTGRKVFSTFGLLGSGKSIETSLNALPKIIEAHPTALFLIIGKTHPNIFKAEGEKYRNMLTARIAELGIENHVRFVNKYLDLPELLEYLQLSDIYVFTSKDPNQAVSGTFSYAISCGCPIISTPIPHAREVLAEDSGIIIDFENSEQLSKAVNLLLGDEILRGSMSANGLQKITSSAWENTAMAHANLFENIITTEMKLKYRKPDINLDHVKRLTTDFGMVQFAKINEPDKASGYTIDDNARAMIALLQHYQLTGDESDLWYIKLYLNFIKYCQQTEGNFLNYVDIDKKFTAQNDETNLADANGRTTWALGYLISKHAILPSQLVEDAEQMLLKALPHLLTVHSTRSMGFTIKGLHYANKKMQSAPITVAIRTLADRLVEMYRHESEQKWAWFESYLTYANSLLPEAMLCAYVETGKITYKITAISSFDFLLSVIFQGDKIKVVSNQGWHFKGETAHQFGEQAIDVAYTILALSRFYDTFGDDDYLTKMEDAFDWFLGKNHLNHIVYNPCTGGCYDGLEETQVNLNQGAESTVSYLMSRLTVEKYVDSYDAGGTPRKLKRYINIV